MTETGDTTEILSLCARPRGMAQNKKDRSLFVACSDDGIVVELDLQTRQVQRVFPGIAGAMSIAFHEATDRLLVSNEGHARATVLDVTTGTVLATLPTGLEPDGVAMTSDASLLFVVSENAGMVHVFSGDTYEPVKQLVTNLRPRRLAVRGDELWVSSEMGSRVEIFDIEKLTKIDEIIFVPRGFRSEQLTPVDILFDKLGTKAFVALGSANHVAVIDAASREIEKYVLVGRRPWGLALSPDGTKLYVLNGLSDDMTIVDTESNRPTRTTRTGLVPHAVEVLD